MSTKERCPECNSIMYYITYNNRGHCGDCGFTINLSMDNRKSIERCPECESSLFNVDPLNKNKCPECNYKKEN